jgi:DNA adenine methylase
VSAPVRPLLRWHGGKWRLAPWIIGHFSAHRVYVEPFGGAASVLLRKERAYSEVYNDLDGEVVNLMRVLQDPRRAARLVELLRLTPFARAEFELSYRPTRNGVERARRLIIRSYMGFGSDGHNIEVRTGFRANSNRSNTTPAHDWGNYPKTLSHTIERLEGVVVERRPALEVMRQHDAQDALHYVDPPYLPATRSEKSRKGGGKYHAYTHEMEAADHVELLTALCGLKGKVVLSGYPAPLYDDTLKGWSRFEKAALADGAKARTEVLWLNPAAAAALGGGQPDMFGAAA